MIPQKEFQDEITEYIAAFLKASVRNMKTPTQIEDSAKNCAALITNLAKVTEFKPDEKVEWPSFGPM